MIELLGWLGALAFALSALPQTVKTLRTRRADDLSWGFLSLWLGGEICMIVYNHLTVNSLPLAANYYLNLACLLPIIWVKVSSGRADKG
jgi:uncharacterized protein with PQ loop repeat